MNHLHCVRFAIVTVMCMVFSLQVGAASEQVAATTEIQTLNEAAIPQVNDPISPAEMQDLSLTAKQNGISLSEAIARYAWNDNFAFAVARVREMYPASFSGARIIDAENASVLFSGPIPSGANSAFEDLIDVAPSVIIEYLDDQGYSERELQAAIARIHYELLDHAGVESASTMYDEDTRTVRSTVLLSGESSLAIGELNNAANGALAESRASELRGIATLVTVGRVPLGGLDSASYHYGGESLSSGCSSGFGTRASSSTAGTRGISTAGHCANSSSDDGVALTFQSEHVGAQGDFHWHTGGATESDDFYAGSSTATEVNLRDVAAVGTPVVGQNLCKNGVTNHASCQAVRKLNVCNGAACNLVEMDARLAAPGDSGGTIYWNYTAYGLHQGWKYDPAWPADRDLFSRADLIDNGLGVWIATN